MDIFLLLVVLVMLIIILRKMTGIKYDLSLLQKELQDLKKFISSSPVRPSEKQELKAVNPAPVIPEPPRVQLKEEIKEAVWPELKSQDAGRAKQGAAGLERAAGSLRPAYIPSTEKQ